MSAVWEWITGQDKVREIERESARAKVAEEKCKGERARAEMLENNMERVSEMQEQMLNAQKTQSERQKAQIGRLQDEMQGQYETIRKDWKENFERANEEKRAAERRFDDEKQAMKEERDRMRQKHDTELENEREAARRNRERMEQQRLDEQDAMRKDMKTERERMDDKEKRLVEKTTEEKSEMRKEHEKQLNHLTSEFDKERETTKTQQESRIQDMKEDVERLEKHHDKEKENINQHMKDVKETSEKRLQERTQILSDERKRMENTLNSELQFQRETSERERQQHEKEMTALAAEKEKALSIKDQEHRHNTEMMGNFFRQMLHEIRASNEEGRTALEQNHRQSLEYMMADKAHERAKEDDRQRRIEDRMDQRDNLLSTFVSNQQRTLDALLPRLIGYPQRGALDTGMGSQFSIGCPSPYYDQPYYDQQQVSRREGQRSVDWDVYHGVPYQMHEQYHRPRNEQMAYGDHDYYRRQTPGHPQTYPRMETERTYERPYYLQPQYPPRDERPYAAGNRGPPMRPAGVWDEQYDRTSEHRRQQDPPFSFHERSFWPPPESGNARRQASSEATEVTEHRHPRPMPDTRFQGPPPPATARSNTEKQEYSRSREGMEETPFSQERDFEARMGGIRIQGPDQRLPPRSDNYPADDIRQRWGDISASDMSAHFLGCGEYRTTQHNSTSGPAAATRKDFDEFSRRQRNSQMEDFPPFSRDEYYERQMQDQRFEGEGRQPAHPSGDFDGQDDRGQAGYQTGNLGAKGEDHGKQEHDRVLHGSGRTPASYTEDFADRSMRFADHHTGGRSRFGPPRENCQGPRPSDGAQTYSETSQAEEYDRRQGYGSHGVEG